MTSPLHRFIRTASKRFSLGVPLRSAGSLLSTGIWVLFECCSRSRALMTHSKWFTPKQQVVPLGNAVPTGKLMAKILGMQLTAQNLQLTIFRPAGSGPLSISKIVICGRVENQELA